MALVGSVVIAPATPAAAAVPPGFVDEYQSDVILNDFTNIEALPLPDGRLIVDERHGHLHIFDVTVPPAPNVPRSDLLLFYENEIFQGNGQLAFALDPNFTLGAVPNPQTLAANRWIYVYFVHDEGSQGRPRLERITYDPSSGTASSSSRIVVWEAAGTVSSLTRLGGDIVFDNAGRVYLAIGDGGNSANAQNLNTPLGKVLRLERGGGTPADNPLVGVPGLDEIWALGIRQVLDMEYDPAGDRIFLADQGSSVQEINLVVRGADFGWDGSCQGAGCGGGVTDPIYHYSGGAITGLDVYRQGSFGGIYEGALFYSDSAQDVIRYLTLDGGVVHGNFDFAANLGGPLHIHAAPDGALYYLANGTHAVRRIRNTSPIPPPSPPSNLVAFAAGEEQVVVSWADNASDETSFRLERSTSGPGGPFALIASPGQNVTQTVDTSVVSGTQYCYRVQALNGGGASPFSNVDCATTPGDPPSFVYLSDLTPTVDVNGWGPSERDMSNGQTAAGDGTPISLGGVVYAKGLGVHADSELRFDVGSIGGGACTTFLADIGIDDDQGSGGNVQFFVLGDGSPLYASGTITGNSPTQSLAIDIAGVSELQLVVDDNNGTINSDWADWADARVECSAPSVPGYSVGLGEAAGVTVAGGAAGLVGDLSIEAWVKWDGTGNRSLLGSWYGGEGEIAVWPGGQLTFYHGNGVDFEGFGSSHPLQPGAWTHVVVTRDVNAGQVAWFVNGVQTDVAASAITPAASGADFFMGLGTLTGFAGGMDEVAVYDRPLSPTEVSEHYDLIDDPAAYGQAVINDAPLNYWRLDEAAGPLAADETGTDPGVYGGAPLFQEPAAAGPAAASVGFDDDAAVLVPDDPSLQITGSLTLEGWVWWDDTGASVGRSLFGKSYLHEGQVVLWPNGQVGFYHGNGDNPSGFQEFLSSQPLTAGQWTHVAVTRDAVTRTVSWYVDGQLTDVMSMDPAIDPAASSADFRLGWRPLALWKGGLDEVAVYDRALPAQEIGQHHGLIASSSAYATAVLADGAVAYWRLDETGGPFARDRAGFHHGFYLGAPSFGEAPAS